MCERRGRESELRLCLRASSLPLTRTFARLVYSTAALRRGGRGRGDADEGQKRAHAARHCGCEWARGRRERSARARGRVGAARVGDARGDACTTAPKPDSVRYHVPVAEHAQSGPTQTSSGSKRLCARPQSRSEKRCSGTGPSKARRRRAASRSRPFPAPRPSRAARRQAQARRRAACAERAAGEPSFRGSLKLFPRRRRRRPRARRRRRGARRARAHSPSRPRRPHQSRRAPRGSLAR